MTRTLPTVAAALAVGTLILSACAHQRPTVAAAPPLPAPAAPEASAAAPVPPPPALPAVCGTDLQCATGQLCLDGRCAGISPSLAACGLTRVHFDYDQAELQPAELPQLQRMARCIQANQPSHVLITGNADERGTVEYNLALGQRRAGAVERYLVDLGVPAPRLSLLTYGKELPLCTGHDEACWRQNRRSGVHPGETARDVQEKVKADEARERAGATQTGG